MHEWAAGLIEGNNFYLNVGGGILRLPTSGGNLAGVVCPASRSSIYAFAVDATRLFFVATQYGVAGSSVQAVDRR